MASLEESLRQYLLAFDGHKKKEMSPSLKKAFDDIYHKEFYNRTSKKNVISRDRLLQIQKEHLANGTKVLLVMFETISTRRIRYELCIIPNGDVSSSCYAYHNISEIKNGQIIRPVKSRMRTFDATALRIVEKKLRAYIDIFDGMAKDFREIEAAFNDLFADEFIHNQDASLLTKQQQKVVVTELLFVGTTAQVVSFLPLDENRFKTIIHYVNDFSNSLVESTGVIFNGKLMNFHTLQPPPMVADEVVTVSGSDSSSMRKATPENRAPRQVSLDLVSPCTQTYAKSA